MSEIQQLLDESIKIELEIVEEQFKQSQMWYRGMLITQAKQQYILNKKRKKDGKRDKNGRK